MIPPDVIERLQGTLALGGGEPPTVEVYYSAENPLKRRYVQATIDATLADANKALSDEIFKEAARYLNLIVVGGSLSLPLVGDVDILGLRNAQAIIDAAIAGLPQDSNARVALQQVSRFARLAADNLDVSKPILASIGSPVKVEEKAIAGSSSSLDVFGVEVAVVISLMFVTLLLAAGMLALEREEHAFGRLVRGLVSRTRPAGREDRPRRAVRVGARGGDAGGAGRVPGPRLEPHARVAARARVRRARLRRARRGDRRADARGARGLAARVHARAADRGAGAGAVGRRRTERSTT